MRKEQYAKELIPSILEDISNEYGADIMRICQEDIEKLNPKDDLNPLAIINNAINDKSRHLEDHVFVTPEMANIRLDSSYNLSS